MSYSSTSNRRSTQKNNTHRNFHLLCQYFCILFALLCITKAAAFDTTLLDTSEKLDFRVVNKNALQATSLSSKIVAVGIPEKYDQTELNLTSFNISYLSILSEIETPTTDTDNEIRRLEKLDINQKEILSIAESLDTKRKLLTARNIVRPGVRPRRRRLTPVCSNIDGTQQNKESCICGSRTCLSACPKLPFVYAKSVTITKVVLEIAGRDTITRSGTDNLCFGGVAPEAGTDTKFSVAFKYNRATSGCSGCVTQILFGVQGEQGKTPKYVCKSGIGTASYQMSYSHKATGIPLEFRLRRDWMYSCRNFFNGGSIIGTMSQGLYCTASKSQCSNEQQGCPKGTFTENTVCKDCAVGYYQNEVGKNICKVCENGQYSNEVGRSACKTDCFEGFYIDDKKACRACSPGKFQDDSGQPSCKTMSSVTCSAGNGFTSASAIIQHIKYSKVVITNIGSASASNLNGAQVLLGHSSDPFDANNSQCGATIENSSPNAIHTMTCSLPGRYLFVRIPSVSVPANPVSPSPSHILSMQRIQLFSSSESEAISIDIQSTGVVEQSSTNCPSGTCRSASFSLGDTASFSETKNQKNPWFRIDLGTIPEQTQSTSNDGVCNACSAGSFKQTDSSTQCQICPRGFFAEGLTISSRSLCLGKKKIFHIDY